MIRVRTLGTGVCSKYYGSTHDTMQWSDGVRCFTSLLNVSLLRHKSLLGVLPNADCSRNVDVETPEHSQLRDLNAHIDEVEELHGNPLLLLAKEKHRR
mmetsp:Transcript_9118/g.24616  ORF Transcript_9118/g.24616 Transcript_9118/m.24616 type:complete len:98 (+) Transcript_9118:153-446(+)